MLQIYDFILIQPYKNEIKINISTTLMRFVGAKSRTASYALLLIGKTLPGERHGRILPLGKKCFGMKMQQGRNMEFDNIVWFSRFQSIKHCMYMMA